MRLLTLTERHQPGNDLTSQLNRMQIGWKRFLANITKAWGRMTFATVVEVTHGDHGWHLHLHALAWLPAWTPYARLQRWWRLALGADADATGADAPGNVDVQEVWRNLAAAGGYVSKSAGWLAEYCAKGESLAHLPAELRAEAVAAFYGRRLLRASMKFWIARTVLDRCIITPLVVQDSAWLRVAGRNRKRYSTRLDTGPP